VTGLDFPDDDVLIKALGMRDRDAFTYLLEQDHPALVLKQAFSVLSGRGWLVIGS
jgi:hypothetical protein